MIPTQYVDHLRSKVFSKLLDTDAWFGWLSTEEKRFIKVFNHDEGILPPPNTAKLNPIFIIPGQDYR